MKTFMKIALICLPLLAVTPAFSQVHVDVNVGTPVVRPYPDAVWIPGYYVYDPVQVRRVWVPGRWRHDNGRHLGWYKVQNNGNGHGNGRGKGHGKGRKD